MALGGFAHTRAVTFMTAFLVMVSVLNIVPIQAGARAQAQAIVTVDTVTTLENAVAAASPAPRSSWNRVSTPSPGPS